jgi:nitroreductase
VVTGPGGLALTNGPDSQRGAAVLEAIRSRRVVRAMTAEPVGREALETLLDAALLDAAPSSSAARSCWSGTT